MLQESFHPVEITDGLWVVPEWRTPPVSCTWLFDFTASVQLIDCSAPRLIFFLVPVKSINHLDWLVNSISVAMLAYSVSASLLTVLCCFFLLESDFHIINNIKLGSCLTRSIFIYDIFRISLI